MINPPSNRTVFFCDKSIKTCSSIDGGFYMYIVLCI